MELYDTINRTVIYRSVLSRVGWNKRSGSTKWERGIFKVRSTIDVHLNSLFADESLLHKSFFLLFQAIGFLLQGVGFLVNGREHRDDLLFLHSLLVEPLRLFHPTVLRCVEQDRTKKSTNTSTPSSSWAGLSLTAMRPEGLSTFDKKGLPKGKNWEYYKISKGTLLPEGLAIVKDEYITSGSKLLITLSHQHSICHYPSLKGCSKDWQMCSLRKQYNEYT